MEKKIKTEDKKIIRKYWVVAVVVTVLSVFIIFKPDNNLNTTKSSEVNTVQTVVSEEDKNVARIDISTKFSEDSKPLFEVYINGSDIPEKQALWMQNMNLNGYVMQKEGSSINIIIKALKDADLSIALRGPEKRGENKQIIPVWVKYTSLTIDGKEVLPADTEVWHNKSFTHIIKAQAGQEYKIHAEWTNADK